MSSGLHLGGVTYYIDPNPLLCYSATLWLSEVSLEYIISSSSKSGAHFMNDHDKNSEKIDFIVTPAQGFMSLPNFLHATPTQLLHHVQNSIAITLLQHEWQQNGISIEFELGWKNRSYNVPPE